MSAKLDDICLFVLKEAECKGADEVEAYAVSNKENAVFIENNDLKQSKSDRTAELGIRVIIDKSVGFSCVNMLQREYVERAVSEAIKLAKVSPTDQFNSMPTVMGNTLRSSSSSSSQTVDNIKKLEGIYDKKAEHITTSNVIDYAAQMLSSARSFDNRVSIDSGSFTSSLMKHVLFNSNGIIRKETITSFIWSIMGMAVDNRETSNFDFQFAGTHSLDEINVESTGRELAESVITSLGSHKIGSFKGQVLLTPSATNEMIQEVIAYSINSHVIQKKASKFEGKVGEYVASELLTVEDDATNVKGLAASSFDREGVPHQRNVIIEKGILKTYIYNTYTSNKESKQSTGNAAGSAKHPPGVSTTNIIVKQGASELRHLVREINEGIIINRFSGNVNPVNGDFSGVVKGGQYVKNGEIKYPVKEVMVAGNVFDALKNIIGISKQVKVLSDAILPHILLDNVSFTAG